MRKIGIIGLCACIILSGCGGVGGNSSGNVTAASSDPASLCTSPETQASMRVLIKSAAESGIRQGWSISLDDTLYFSIRAVIAQPDMITFSQTTLESVNAETNAISCVTSLGIADDTGAEVAPRLSFEIQRALGTGEIVVTLSKPFEVRAAMAPLGAAINRVTKAQAVDTDASSSNGTADTDDSQGTEEPESEAEKPALTAEQVAAYNARPLIEKACWIPHTVGTASQDKCTAENTEDDVVEADRLYNSDGFIE